jgi:hypothetical protein
MYQTIAILLAALILSECVSYDERMQRGRYAGDEADDAKCRSAGAERGTLEYVECKRKLLELRMKYER